MILRLLASFLITLSLVLPAAAARCGGDFQTFLAAMGREAQAAGSDIVRVTEHFKPGFDEVAAVLPRAMGERLLSLAARRGWMKKHVGLHIRSTSLWGYLMLRFLARLRPLRPRSLRYAQEHEALAAWLGAMQQVLALPDASAFALALAGLPQVLKGYGETQQRGRHERHDEVAPELQVDAEKTRAILPQHGEHRAGLDRDVEHVAARRVEVEQVAGEDQVAGARDRQEFRQPLDDAEDERVEQVLHLRKATMLVQ